MKWKKSSPPWPLSIGQKQFGLENGITSKKKRGRGRSEKFRRGNRLEGLQCSVCGTRDLGIKRPYWRALMFSDEIKIDMRSVCPKDVTKKDACAEGPISVLEEVGSKARV